MSTVNAAPHSKVLVLIIMWVVIVAFAFASYLAGGIEDWQDVQNEDVDRYGFIVKKTVANTSSWVVTTNLTPATSTTTGALQVSGGAGIGGNLYVGGNVYAGTTRVEYNIPHPFMLMGT